MLENEGRHGSRWQAIVSIQEIGCAAQTLNAWVKRAEVDGGRRVRVAAEMGERMKPLERETRELRQSNESLRKASASCARAEPDRRSKT